MSEPSATNHTLDPELAAAPRFPWPPAADESIVFAAAETWRQSVFSPSDFFRAMPPHGYASALAYYTAMGVIAAAIRLFWFAIFDRAGLDFSTILPFDVPPPTARERLVEFLLSPLFLVAALFVTSAIVHVSLRLVGGARRPFVTTTRVFAFAYGVDLLAVVPVLGSAVAAIWMLVLSVIGLREAHGTTTGRALLALLLPLLLLAVLLTIGAVFFLAGVSTRLRL